MSTIALGLGAWTSGCDGTGDITAVVAAVPPGMSDVRAWSDPTFF